MNEIEIKVKNLVIAVAELQKQNKLLSNLQKNIIEHNKLLMSLDRRLNSTSAKHSSKLSKLNSDINDLYSRLSTYK